MCENPDGMGVMGMSGIVLVCGNNLFGGAGLI